MNKTIEKVMQIPFMICKFAFTMLFARLYFTALKAYPGNTGRRMTIVCQRMPIIDFSNGPSPISGKLRVAASNSAPPLFRPGNHRTSRGIQAASDNPKPIKALIGAFKQVENLVVISHA
jgi:hypothetical protein